MSMPFEKWRAYVRCRNVDGLPVHAPKAFGPRPTDTFPPVTCAACDKDFKQGDYTTLLALGPGIDEEARAKAKDGSYYSAVAVECHLGCVTGSDTPAGAKTNQA